MRPIGDGPFPIVVYNHGSRVGRSGRANLDQPTLSFKTRPWPGVTAGRCVVFFPEGRGYAGSEGPTPNDCGSLDDVVAYLFGRADDVIAGIHWVAEQSWADDHRIAITGCSHGAVVALFAAASGLFGSVIAQAPGVSISHPVVGQKSMMAAIAETDAPILLQHAEDDTLCPFETSRKLYHAGKKAGRDIALLSYPPVPDLEGHAQFDFENRAIWARDFDRALIPVVGPFPLISELG